MSSLEFTYLKQYYALEPFGASRDNLHSAQIAAIIANVNRNPKKTKPFKVSDFMWVDPKSRKDQETADFISNLQMRAKPKDGN
ncbi:MAG: DUF4035 domain-containing protein [Porticoccus sp.]|nr:DUF4035 domain-containing protein [Porticoccus sp.]